MKMLHHECGGFGKDHICVKIASIADLPSRFGDFQVVAFYNNRDGKEHAAFVHGDITGKENVPVRMHSECLTGDVAGSLRCDCRDQFEAAMSMIGQMENGILLYLRQEGRGHWFYQQDPCLQFAGFWLRYRAGEPGIGIPRRRA